jgi:hypothetical protein
MLTVEEREFDLPLDEVTTRGGALRRLNEAVTARLAADETPVRFAVTATDADRCRCEVGVLRGSTPAATPPSIFDFAARTHENAESFNAVMLVPTGIGCDIGGHAGDAGPAARLLGSVCDRLILHPNVVNASDMNEMPGNALYVEGSVIARFLQGTVALAPTRANRVLVVMDGDREDYITEAVINSVNAGRAVYGLSCPKVVGVVPAMRLRAAFTASGRAVGCVEGLERLLAVLERERGTFDAVALSGVIHMPFQVYMDYLRSDGEAAHVNPMGGAEAILTHALSLLAGVPSAHAPMYVAPESLDEDVHPTNPGVVDPRMAAEVVSITFFQSVLKGLHRAPRLVPLMPGSGYLPGVLTVADVSCLVIPDGALGLPVLAALEQRIPVVAVRGNRNRMRCDLQRLPWAAGQLIVVDGYLEAAGALAALRAGLSPESVRRPLRKVPVQIG